MEMEETKEFVPVIVDGKVADETGKIYDLTKTFDDGVIALLTLGIIIALVLTIALTFRAIKKNEGKFVPFLVGIVSYIYFGYLINSIVMMILSVITKQDMLGVSAPALVLSTTLSALICVFGRYLTLLIVRRRYDTVGSGLTMSTGFAFANVALMLYYWFSDVVIMTGVNEAGGIINMANGADAQTVLNYAKSIDPLFAISSQDVMYQSLYLALLIAFTTYSAVIMHVIAEKKISFYWNYAIVGVVLVINVTNILAGYEFIPGNNDYIVAFIIQVLLVIMALRTIFFYSKVKFGDLLRPVNKSGSSVGTGKMMEAPKQKKGKQQFPKFK